MCILFVALGVHRRFPLVIAANRDEQFARPSANADYWPEHADIFGGRDLLAGGSWLAVSRAGRVAAITNIRNPALTRDGALSRGEWVRRYLQCASDAGLREQLVAEGKRYNPFNLLFGDQHGLQVYNSVTESVVDLTPGYHALSNGPVDDYWPKMSRGVALLEQHLEQRTETLDVEQILEIMRDATQADDHLLPQTGVGLEAERQLSSIFIAGEEYGTRTTSLLYFSATQVGFHEQQYGPHGQALSRADHVLAINE